MSEENKSVEEYLTELRSVIDNSDDLSYDDIMNEMNVAYKVLGIVSAEEVVAGSNEEEKKANTTKEISNIMNALGDMAKEKKPKKVVAKAVKPAAEEKTIPKPVFDNEEVAEAKVESAVSSTEPTQEQILSGYVKEDTTKVVNNTQINVQVNVDETESRREDENSVGITYVEKPAERTIPKPVFEENVVGNYREAEVITPAMNPDELPRPFIGEATTGNASEEKESMVLDAPTEESKIFVSDEEDVKEQVESITAGSKLDYSFLESKPFEGDDDIDTEGDEDLSNLQFEDKPSEEEIRQRKIAEEYSSIPEYMQTMNVKSVSRKKVSDTIKALQKISTEGLNIDKISMFDYKESDETIHREYLKTRNDMISSPKISRISLLMSGHYEEVSAYGNYDLTGIQRTLTNPDTNFVDREVMMLNSIYNHVKYVSYAAEKPSFEEWCKNIAYPDMGSLYYAVYDANSVGDNNYSFGCPFCGGDVNISRKNRDLTVAVPKELTQDKLEKFITCKDIMKLDSTETSKWAKNTTVRKQLPNSKIIIDYKVPTLYDYLIVLNTAQRISRRDLNDSLDLSSIDIFNSGSEGNEEDAMRILAYLYVNSIGIPAQVEGTNKFRYIRLTNKADIIEHINGLDIEDYNSIFTGQKVQDLMIKSATKYYIEDVNCSECGKNIKYVSLDPKQIFFFKIGEEMNRLMM